MDTSIKRLLEVAGVDITKGKAKELCEGKKEKVIDLSTFLKQHPDIEATVRMGTYSLGHSKTTKVTGAAALKQAVNSFIKKHVDVRGDEVSVIRDGDRMDIVLYPGDGDPESDQIGSFTIHSEGNLIKEGKSDAEQTDYEKKHDPSNLRKTKEVNKLEDIAELGWVGNYFHDQKRFHAVEKFIRAQKDPAIQKKAIQLMSKYGMGEDAPVSDADLKSFLSGEDE